MGSQTGIEVSVLRDDDPGETSHASVLLASYSTHRLVASSCGGSEPGSEVLRDVLLDVGRHLIAGRELYSP